MHLFGIAFCLFKRAVDSRVNAGLLREQHRGNWDGDISILFLQQGKTFRPEKPERAYFVVLNRPLKVQMKKKQKAVLSKKTISLLPRHILKNLHHPLLRLGWAMELGAKA
jgi:hypothetical protein